MTEKTAERYPARFARRLTEVYPELSFTRAKRVIEGGQVSVDGQLLFDPGAYVAPTAQLVWDPNRKVERPVEGPKVELLHSDADVVVAVKPAGLLTQPTTEREKVDFEDRQEKNMQAFVKNAGLKVYRTEHKEPKAPGRNHPKIAMAMQATRSIVWMPICIQ